MLMIQCQVQNIIYTSIISNIYDLYVGTYVRHIRIINYINIRHNGHRRVDVNLYNNIIFTELTIRRKQSR